MINCVHKILFGRDLQQKKTVQIFEQRNGELSLTEEAERKGLGLGIFGQSLAGLESLRSAIEKLCTIMVLSGQRHLLSFWQNLHPMTNCG